MQRAALGLILLVAAAHSWHRRFLIDDAYISFRYAANLAAGNGLVFNPGERVEGYSNFLWTLALAAGMAAGARPEMLSQAAGIAASVALLVVLWRFARDIGLTPAWSLLPPALLAVNRSYALWASGGLETRLFSLLVVAAAWRLHRELAGPRPASYRVSSTLLALACLTRPEGYLAAAVALGARAWHARRGGGSTEAASRWRALWGAAAVIGLVCAGHEVWRLSYYGDWVPNSFHAKVAGPRLVSGAVYLAAFARDHVVPGAAVLLLAIASARRFPRLAVGAFCLPFSILYAVYTLAVGGDHFEFRFVDVLLPLLALGAARVAAQATSASAAPLAWGAAVLLTAGSAWPAYNGFTGVEKQVSLGGATHYVSIVSAETESAYLAYWRRIGEWMRDHAAPGESIAVTPAGVIPYLTGLRTLDMLGINDREIARGPARPGRNVGHEKRAEADVARARGITYLVADPVIAIEPAPHPPHAVEVDFGDFRWYFLPLTSSSRIPPGTKWQADGRRLAR